MKQLLSKLALTKILLGLSLLCFSGLVSPLLRAIVVDVIIEMPLEALSSGAQEQEDADEGHSRLPRRLRSTAFLTNKFEELPKTAANFLFTTVREHYLVPGKSPFLRTNPPLLT